MKLVDAAYLDEFEKGLAEQHAYKAPEQTIRLEIAKGRLDDLLQAARHGIEKGWGQPEPHPLTATDLCDLEESLDQHPVAYLAPGLAVSEDKLRQIIAAARRALAAEASR